MIWHQVIKRATAMERNINTPRPTVHHFTDNDNRSNKKSGQNIWFLESGHGVEVATKVRKSHLEWNWTWTSKKVAQTDIHIDIEKKYHSTYVVEWLF